MTEQAIESPARVQLNLRLPVDVHTKAVAMAGQTKQSMNGLLVALIRKGLAAEAGVPAGEARAG